MTIDELIAYIEANAQPGDFHLEARPKGVVVRSVECGECPICWVGTKLGKNPNKCCEAFAEVAERLGMERTASGFIVGSADGYPGMTRDRLLKACKIVEGP